MFAKSTARAKLHHLAACVQTHKISELKGTYVYTLYIHTADNISSWTGGRNETPYKAQVLYILDKQGETEEQGYKLLQEAHCPLANFQLQKKKNCDKTLLSIRQEAPLQNFGTQATSTGEKSNLDIFNFLGSLFPKR